eukprot:9083335-Pyramimonas_sp.AAC.1
MSLSKVAGVVIERKGRCHRSWLQAAWSDNAPPPCQPWRRLPGFSTPRAHGERGRAPDDRGPPEARGLSPRAHARCEPAGPRCAPSQCAVILP